MRRSIFTLILTALATMWQPGAQAEDIDVFTGASINAQPNVLFIIDNTANWNLVFANEMAALSAVFSALPTNPDGTAAFNIGIMFATESGNGNSNSSGGYVRAAIRPMTATNKALYAAMINAFDKLGDKGDGGRSALEMVEAYQYFSGGTPYAGSGKVKADFTLNLCPGCGSAAAIAADKAVYALPNNALSSEYATSYTPPLATTGCTKNFIIYISNGPNQENSSADATANAMLQAAGGDTTLIPISPAGSATNPSDEWARFMKQSTQGVVTFTIDVNPPSTGQGPGWSALLESMASVGGGKYQAVRPGAGGSTSASDIAAAVRGDLSEIQAVNSVYASVSLPASANIQGTYLNQVYIGMFRPDPSAAPRWYGNLKQYQMGFIGTSLRLEDADGTGAINNQTGFISECAHSFWTPSTVNTYWTFFPEGTCIPPSGQSSDYYRNSDYPDGNMVEKGGAGYLLRCNSTTGTCTNTNASVGNPPAGRQVYTCSPTFSTCASTSTLTQFTTGNSALTPAVLGAPDSATATQYIQWERGLDVLDENHNQVTTGEMRPSAHGDVIHSHPVAINYGTSSAPSVVVYYGDNDGALHAINGNQSSNIPPRNNGVLPGGELWSFVPPEFYPSISRLYNNTQLISFPNVSPSAGIGTPVPKSYGIDGPMTAYANGTNTWLYAPMRRGGRVLYAFDVSSPASPALKWKVGCPNNFPTSGTVDDTGCTTGFTRMGQAWSSAKIIKAAGYGAGNSPMIITGGGYDTCEDSDPNTCTSSTKGNAVYVLDASTGQLLNTLNPFNTTRAVIADIAIAPDASGLALYAYVVDLGGNIYRINIGSSAPANWTMTQIASLGCATPASCVGNRKFMFAPDLVYQNGVYTLLLGSGDREKPLLYTALGAPAGSVVNGVTNYFFAVQDNPSSGTWLASENGNCGANLICLKSLLPVTSATSPSAASLAAKKGWYMSLNPTEQVVTSAITIYGTIYFSTHTPAVPVANSCTSSLGTTRLYTPLFGRPAIVSTILPPVGLPPSPVAGLVNINNQTVPFCIGCDKTSPLQSTEPQAAPGVVPAQPKARVYWYIQR